MWPEGMPGRGSGVEPSNRPGGRASTTASFLLLMLAATSSAERTRPSCVWRGQWQSL